MQDRNQFIGGFAILMLTAAAVYLTREVASTHEFTSALSALNGWAGAHAMTLGFVAAGTIAVVGISVPVILVHRDADGGGRVAAVGRNASSYAMVILCVASIPAIAYLVGMGVFAAKAAFTG